LDRRQEKKRQKRLINFVRYFWDVLEPVQPFVEGWCLEALCEHLEAVTAGKINRFLANVPPGFMKSLLVNVFWPAWEWGPMDLGHMRYVTFSYASHLTERDNAKFRDLVKSKKYQDMWGDRIQLVEDGKVKVSNTKTGWKFASSVGGVGTGERGNRIICLPYEARVLSDIGEIAIGEIVEKRLQIRVLSFDHESERAEWQSILEYETNPAGDYVEIELVTGEKLVCTSDHLVFTVASGYKRADELTPNDEVLIV
jgi:hypothetical protein